MSSAAWTISATDSHRLVPARSCCLRGRNVLDARDMENGARDIFLSERAGVQVDPDLNRVSFDERHIVIRDVESPAVREGDAEGPERNFVHALAQLHRGYHD